MLHSNLLTRKSAIFTFLLSVALASPAPQNVGAGTAVAGPAASATTATGLPAGTSQPKCLGVGASVIPPMGPGPNPGAAEDSGFSDGTGGDGNSPTARRDLRRGEMRNILYERQYDSMGASDGSDGALGGSDGSFDGSDGTSDGTDSAFDGSVGAPAAPPAGVPIQVPPNTTYCGWLGGMGMQSDMLIFSPGTFELTWQNVTGNGHVSINYAEAGADSTWANQDSDSLSDLPTIVSFPNDGIQYQVVYYGEYPANGLSWFMTQVA
ncbi:hypothetical protein MMC26_004954 [Xylographa opegraphella]|nr:hypothetical protein [Xylographa opegraphella]